LNLGENGASLGSLSAAIEECTMQSNRGFHLAAALVMALAGMALAQAAESNPTLVETDAGPVRGVSSDGVISFKGIPYAQPPLGALRWRAPQPVTPWQDVRDAADFGPACMQTDDIPKSEDCLTLNVWRSAASSEPLPVMVWIYGGALVHGHTSQYPSDALAKQGVVIVSMNYRLGRFGFFAHPALAEEAPGEVRGNYGYMDQRAALQWVRRNIAAFGGDPNKVTIFGESAGGGSVMVHLTSPLSRGLFHQAIMQSPGLPAARAKVTPLTELADAETMAVAYARSVGVTERGPAALKALRALPPETLVEGTSAPEEVTALSAGKPIIGVAGPIRDGTFVLEAPEAAFAAGRQAMVPVMIGANAGDLGIGRAKSKDELFALFGADADQARKLYDPQGDEPLDALKQQVFADKTMIEPARHLANEMARAGQPTWLYRFSYVAESQRGTLKGTPHGFEIPYTFDIPGALVGDKVTAADRAMGELASAYWVSFAKTGDPNGGGRPPWPRHEPAVNRLMTFSNAGPSAGPDPLKGRLDLWQTMWRSGR
jgi:para-nitrobenzyl esterase